MPTGPLAGSTSKTRPFSSPCATSSAIIRHGFTTGLPRARTDIRYTGARKRMSRFENALLAHPEEPLRHTLLERIEGAGAAVQATTDGVQALEIVRLAPH